MRSPAKTVLGLDIGRSELRVVVASANGGLLNVHRAETISIPPDLSDAGETLRRWWSEQNLNRVPVVCGVGGSRVLYQATKMEDGDPRDPDQIARMEALRFGEMADAAMESSATPWSQGQAPKGLLLSMARPDLLESALRPAQLAGMNVVNACPAPVAGYNGVVALGEPIHQATMFVDLGEDHTEVAVGNGQSVLFARSFAMGTEQLTRALAGRANVPARQAGRMRLQAEHFEDLPGDMDEVCQNFVRQWMQELNACLQIFEESPARPLAESGVRRILLGGTGSGWKPLRTALKAVSPLPLSGVGRLPGQESLDSHPYIVACGLAADGLGIARAPSSLLTAPLRQSLNRRRNKRYWVMTGFFAVAAAGMLVAATRVAFVRERKLLQRHNATLQRSDRIRRDSESLLAKKELVEQMLHPLEAFVANSTRIRELTLFIAEHKEKGDFLTFLGDSESYLRLRLASEEDETRRRSSPREQLALQTLTLREAASGDGVGMTRLIVEGFTPRENLGSVKNLIETLREHPDVARADLLSDDLVFVDPEQDPQWARTGDRRFVLDLQLVPATPGPDPTPEAQP